MTEIYDEIKQRNGKKVKMKIRFDSDGVRSAEMLSSIRAYNRIWNFPALVRYLTPKNEDKLLLVAQHIKSKNLHL